MKPLPHVLTALVILLALLATACRATAPAAVGLTSVPPKSGTVEPHDGQMSLRLARGDRRVAALPAAWTTAVFTAYSPTALVGVMPVAIPFATFIPGAGFFEASLNAGTVPAMPALRPATDYVIDVDLHGATNPYQLEAFGYLAGRTLQAGPNSFTIDMLNLLNATTPIGSPGIGDGGPLTDAIFNWPHDLTVDTNTNDLYIADSLNHRIRKITAGGVISTVVGNGEEGDSTGGGAPLLARLNEPEGVCYDAGANKLYFADTDNDIIRVLSGGVVTNFAGGPQGYVDATGTAAMFDNPSQMTRDGAGNLYVADRENHAIRRINIATKVVTTIAGKFTLDAFGNRVAVNDYLNGIGNNAAFDEPGGVAYYAASNVLLVADTDNHRIRMIDLATMNVTTLSGDASGLDAGGNPRSGYASSSAPPTQTFASARFNLPKRLALAGTKLYVGDEGNHRIQVLDFANGVVDTLSGRFSTGSSRGYVDDAGGNGNAARYQEPAGVAVDTLGNVYIADTKNNTIRKIAPGGATTSYAGSPSAGVVDGPIATAKFRHVWGVAEDASGAMYVSDETSHVIRKISGGVVTTIAGTGREGFQNGPGTGAWAVAAWFDNPSGLAYRSGFLYVADAHNDRIRRIDLATNEVFTFAGIGDGTTDGNKDTAAQFKEATSLAFDANGNLFVTDTGSHRIRRIDALTGEVTTFAGSSAGFLDGQGTASQFNQPHGLAFDPWGNLYVADSNNNRVRKITPGGAVTTYAGSGTYGIQNGPGATAQFQGPYGVMVDLGGNVHVIEKAGQGIRKIALDGYVTTVAGGNEGYVDARRELAEFSEPHQGIIQADGTIYVADQNNHCIRRIK